MRKISKLMQALCLVLAMCMAMQFSVLAAEVENTSSSEVAVSSSDIENTGTADNSTPVEEEKAATTDAETSTPVEEEKAATTDAETSTSTEEPEVKTDATETPSYGLNADGKFYNENGMAAYGVYEGKYYEDGLPATNTYDNKYYVNGVLANGVYGDKYYVDGVLSTGDDSTTGKHYESGILANGTYGDKYYVNGVLANGTQADGKYYENGVVAVKNGLIDGVYYQNDVPYTGGVAIAGTNTATYYQNGFAVTNLRGWVSFLVTDGITKTNTINGDAAYTYYFNDNGLCVTGWNYLQRNGNTYKYYFYEDGKLCKNLYKLGTSWKRTASKMVISRATHTATIYAKDSNGKYDIPTKSFVISCSRQSANFKDGTYKLTTKKTWFTIDDIRWWYKWGVYISGSGSWCHSEQYYHKGKHYSLRTSSYNALGTNQSKKCIRMQVVNAKLVYDMKPYIKSVVLNRSKNKGPFGQMKITDNVDRSGKISLNYDPTDFIVDSNYRYCIG